MPKVLFIVWVLLSISPLSAAEPGRSPPDPVVTNLQDLMAEQRFSGAVVVVGRPNGIVSFDAVGLRDIEATLPMTKDTIFRLGSYRAYRERAGNLPYDHTPGMGVWQEAHLPAARCSDWTL
jgi:hypothetical protein